MRITRDQAKTYFTTKTQLRGLKSADDLPESGVEYRAIGPVLGLFHCAPWPRVWMGHFAVKPEGWGSTIAPAKQILIEFWEEVQPDRIIGWTDKSNRAALSFTRRLGFVVDGEMPLPGGHVILQGWAR